MATYDGTMSQPGVLRRVVTFNAVGVMGVFVQQALLFSFTEWIGWHYLVATACAVQATILHNFVWHERWTWSDRVAEEGHLRWRRLVRFNLVNGLLAITGQVVLTGLYVAAFDLHYSLANLSAVGTCAVASFLANDRLVFQGLAAHRGRVGATVSGLGLLVAMFAPVANAAELQPRTTDAWIIYVEATEKRIREELASDGGFLVQDFDPNGAAVRSELVDGAIYITEMTSRGDDGSKIQVPGGAIHHWRGGIFIPGLSLNDVLHGVQSPLRQEDLQEDVLESRVLERTPDQVKVFLKLRRKKFVTVHYNTEHVMQHVRHEPARASSRSVATKIAELDQVGMPNESEKPIGNDSGFLWRLNSYWRYEEVPGGVIVECESISLSRGVPSVVRWLVAPMIRSAARESMERTLTSMRGRLLAAVEAPAVARHGAGAVAADQ